jgi:V-type H+-transporting ATPase subunit E
MAQQVARSHVVNKTRLQILSARNEALSAIFEDGRKRLREIAADKRTYESLLENLVLEAALGLMDTHIIVRMRKEDYSIGKAAVENVKKEFNKLTRMDLEVVINESNPLPANSYVLYLLSAYSPCSTLSILLHV